MTKINHIHTSKHEEQFSQIYDDLTKDYEAALRTKEDFEIEYPNISAPFDKTYGDIDFDIRKEYKALCSNINNLRNTIMNSSQVIEFMKNKKADTETKIGNYVPVSLLVEILSRTQNIIIVDVPDNRKSSVLGKLRHMLSDIYREAPNLKALLESRNGEQ